MHLVRVVGLANTAFSCKRRIDEAREARMKPPLVSCNALLHGAAIAAYPCFEPVGVRAKYSRAGGARRATIA